MPRRDDDLFDAHSIVPDTDERVTHMSHSRPAASKGGNIPASAPSNFARLALLSTTLLGLTAACGFFHYQLTQQQTLNSQLQIRLDTLESQLGLTSSAASQTSETLGEKVKTLEGKLAANNTEIGKLSGANDKNRKSLEEQEKILASLQTSITDTKKSVIDITKRTGDAIQNLDANSKSLVDAQSSINTLQQRVTQGETLAREASQQAAMAQEQSEQTQVKLNALEKRLADHDESLRSIDSFRRSVNTDLGKLKQERAASAGVTPPQ